MVSIPTYKVVLVGDPGVGKSSILRRYVNNTFLEQESETLAALDSQICSVNVGGKEVKLHIWDTAGQERYSSLTATYYREASAAAVIFDITNQESFNDIGHWMEDSDRYSSAEICKILVGNKADLEKNRVIGKTTGEAAGQKHHAPYIETSAKEGTNIVSVFTTLAERLLQINQSTSSNVEVKLTKPEKNKGSKCIRW